jgi:hypothetical protein
MTLHDSRLRHGTLKLGDTPTQLDFSCQITNCRITTAYSDDGDPVTTLCGDTTPAPRKSDGHKLEGTLVQDFDLDEASGGVIAFIWSHDLEIVAYEFVPDDQGAPTITGTLQVEIPTDTYGGDVNARVTSDFAWNLQQTPTFAWETSGASASQAASTPVAA